MRSDTLIVEDVMLLLLDDERGPRPGPGPCTTSSAARCSSSSRCAAGSRPTTRAARG
ncbi:hypothetical protein ACFQYP_15985 [Nonomuraea antimicrobica]